MPVKSEYVPGICNIGQSEIKLRKRFGWFGLGSAIILWSVFYVLYVPPLWRLLLFIPAILSAIGFLQAGMHFCAAFGLQGVINFGSRVGHTDTIEQAEYRRKDWQKARLIIFYAIMAGSAVAAVGYLL